MVSLTFHEIFERAERCTPCEQAARERARLAGGRVGATVSPLTLERECKLLEYMTLEGGEVPVAQFQTNTDTSLLMLVDSLSWAAGAASDNGLSVLWAGNSATDTTPANGQAMLDGYASGDFANKGWVFLMRKETPIAGNAAPYVGIWTNDVPTIEKYAGKNGEFAIVWPHATVGAVIPACPTAAATAAPSGAGTAIVWTLVGAGAVLAVRAILAVV